jgi:hypothetical protein
MRLVDQNIASCPLGLAEPKLYKQRLRGMKSAYAASRLRRDSLRT